LAAVSRSNCFVVIPPHHGKLEAGNDVSVLLAYA
jgi:molybdopterin biosynthesis enzyme